MIGQVTKVFKQKLLIFGWCLPIMRINLFLLFFVRILCSMRDFKFPKLDHSFCSSKWTLPSKAFFRITSILLYSFHFWDFKQFAFFCFYHFFQITFFTFDLEKLKASEVLNLRSLIFLNHGKMTINNTTNFLLFLS